MPKRAAAVSIVVSGFSLLFLFFLFVLQANASMPIARILGSPKATGGQRFLTLPFNDPNILVQNGWLYNYGSLHQGIDYILGQRDTGKWQSFDVVAAADGWACGNCTSRQGNAVWIKHTINGQIYYTYYGHLASIESNIPIGNQQNTVWVTRGQKLGDAGSTGADVVHLHFQVNLPSGPVDPYDLWSTREPYLPGCTVCQLGISNLWTTNPPSFANGDQLGPAPAGIVGPAGPPPPPPSSGQYGDDPGSGDGTGAASTATLAPLATRTPAPTPTATPIPCNLPLEKTLAGTLTASKSQFQYCMAGTAGEWVSIRMFASNNASLDTLLKLYTPDGKLFAQDDDGAQIGSNSFLVKRLPQTGTYKVVATRYSGTGDYHIRAEQGSKSALGDLNRDCIVNQDDVQLMQQMLGTNDPNGDLNMDGVVDQQDVQIQQERLGRGCTLGTP